MMSRTILTVLVAVSIAVPAACGDDVTESPALDRCLERAADDEERADLCRQADDCLAEAQNNDDLETCVVAEAISDLNADEFVECMEFAEGDEEIQECGELLDVEGDE